jgi:CHAD domain-containing protein
MAFRFKLSEPFEEGCKRVACEQIERAQTQLNGPDTVVAVHETRKALKRLRALLRLIRPALGDDAFHAENADLRETGRLLSGARDRHVLIETMAKLDAASEAASGLVEDVRRALNGKNGGDGLSVDPAAVKEARRRLAEAQRRLGAMRLSGKGFNVVGPGLKASYKKARRAFRHAYAEGTDEAFHEWRKGTQQHWRHMLLLSRAWPAAMSARADEARRLSQILGDDHDLALLVAFVHSDKGAALGAQRAEQIEVLARERQKELRALAHPIGKRLYAGGAGALRKRIETYWEAAGALKEQAPEEDASARERKVVARVSAPRRRRAAAGQAKPL